MPQDIVSLDFETYSATSLPTHGLHRYVSCPTFQPLISTVWRNDPYGIEKHCQDYTDQMDVSIDTLREVIGDALIAAHNAGFEQWVLKAIGLDYPSNRFIDTAVLARAAGASGRLAASSAQLLPQQKMDEGSALIKRFCIPGPLQEETDSLAFNPKIIEMYPDEWDLFRQYCDRDARLSLDLVQRVPLSATELRNQALTMDMNNVGWKVDVAKVEEMQRRYHENMDTAVTDFRMRHDATDLNLNSLKQLKEWCRERGVKATSFDEKSVAKMITVIEKKLYSPLPTDKHKGYRDVLDLLRLKQTLGGSSLKKLQVILDTVGDDGRLRDQYIHIGAGQSWRTTGRSVQMQNLKRLAEPADMDELDDLDSEWDNTKLAENLRQVFTASHPQGSLIVGDFSSVESRGLAWYADAQWKLEAYRQGQDMYKVLAAKIFSKRYELITKPERTFGKVGELSCGYQAGPDAVSSFAESMGSPLEPAEAGKLVRDWRDANPEIVDFWARLDDALRAMFRKNTPEPTVACGPAGAGFELRFDWIGAPTSLVDQHPGARTLRVSLWKPGNDVPMFYRLFHGLYERGKQLCYYKPSERKTGAAWSAHFVDPKTKQVRFYSIYGGKLAGILTQSLCRELFFQALRDVEGWVQSWPNVQTVGQFHDEIVLDWVPGQLQRDRALNWLEQSMTSCSLEGFPMGAEIKHDYRYTK